MSAGRPLLIVAEDVTAKPRRRWSSTSSADRPYRRRQGSRLRRLPQGDARGHRYPDRRQRPLRVSARSSKSDAHDLGSAKKIVIDKDNDDHRCGQAPRSRADRPARREIEGQERLNREKLRNVCARRRRGEVNVGAATERDKEKKARVEDALHARLLKRAFCPRRRGPAPRLRGGQAGRARP